MADELFPGMDFSPASHLPVARLVEKVELIANSDGLTEVHIPPDSLWDCVDCFAENRFDASFSFTPVHFVARLRHASAPRIREALGNWITHQHAVTPKMTDSGAAISPQLLAGGLRHSLSP